MRLLMRSLLARLVKFIAFRYGRCTGLYCRLCQPNGFEYAEFLKRHGSFRAIGEGCSILTTTNITDPAYVRIGNNVQFSNCTLVGHDGAVAMLNKAFHTKLDSVGKIDIRDNVFVGYQAVVMPNVTIGPDAIVAAGAVVTRDVQPGDIVAGVPARPIGKVRDLVEKLQRQTDGLPWADLIRSRTIMADPLLEPELVRRRVAHFYDPVPPRTAA